MDGRTDDTRKVKKQCLLQTPIPPPHRKVITVFWINIYQGKKQKQSVTDWPRVNSLPHTNTVSERRSSGEGKEYKTDLYVELTSEADGKKQPFRHVLAVNIKISLGIHVDWSRSFIVTSRITGYFRT